MRSLMRERQRSILSLIQVRPRRIRSLMGALPLRRLTFSRTPLLQNPRRTLSLILRRNPLLMPSLIPAQKRMTTTARVRPEKCEAVFR